MSSVSSLTHVGMASLVRCCPKLRSITIADYLSADVDPILVAIASTCPCLTALGVRSYKASDAGIAAIAEGCRGLLSLDIRRSQKVADNGIVEVARRCPQLTSLNMRDSRGIVGAFVATIVEHCHELEKLWFGSWGSNIPLVDLGNVLLAMSRNCPRLTKLSIVRAHIDDQLVEVMTHCPIEELDVSKCSKLTAAGLTAVARLPGLRLRELIMYNLTCMSDALLLELARIQSLPSVAVGGQSRVTKAGIAACKAAFPLCDVQCTGSSHPAASAISGSFGVTAGGRCRRSALRPCA
jgi:hypothetical protein